MNASGSNLLQLEKNVNNTNELFSSFLGQTPTGVVDVIKIDTSAKTISGVFNGTISQSPLLVLKILTF